MNIQPKEKYIRKNFFLPLSLVEKLKKISHQFGYSEVEVVRMVLEKFLNEK